MTAEQIIEKLLQLPAVPTSLADFTTGWHRVGVRGVLDGKWRFVIQADRVVCYPAAGIDPCDLSFGCFYFDLNDPRCLQQIDDHLRATNAGGG